MKNDKPKFSLVSSWHDSTDDGKFPHIFILEFENDGWNKTIHHVYNNVAPSFKKVRKNFLSYLENYGEQDTDWSIGKHRGDFNLGAALILRFKNKNDAIAFMLENS